MPQVEKTMPGELDRPYWERGSTVVGIDEVGRGPLAGPVTAAAVIILPSQVAGLPPGINDSKKLSPEVRERLSDWILNNLTWGIAEVSVKQIETTGIADSTYVAMYLAVLDAINKPRNCHGMCHGMIPGPMVSSKEFPELVRRADAGETCSKYPLGGHLDRVTSGRPLCPSCRAATVVLVDGPVIPKHVAEHTGLEVLAHTKGDSRSLAIAAASIVAKVNRDRYMVDVLDKQYPAYHFKSNKGYGSADHIKALVALGPTPHHRMSFLRPEWGGRDDQPTRRRT